MQYSSSGVSSQRQTHKVIKETFRNTSQRVTLDPEDSPKVLKRKPLPLVASQQISSLEHVLDLATVELQACQSLDLILSDVVGSSAGDLGVEADGAVEEASPDGLAGGSVEGRILEGHVDSALEGRIHVLHAVGREEEDALVVLERSQEDGHDSVALDIVGRSSLEEDVTLVQQEDSIPVSHHLQDTAKVLLDIVRIAAEITSAHDIQRNLHLLGHRLGSQSLADTGTTREQHDDTLAFARDDVVKHVLVLDLALGECEDKVLLVLGKDKRLKGLVVELDFRDVIDEELHPSLILERVTPHHGVCHEELVLSQRRTLGSGIRLGVLVIVVAEVVAGVNGVEPDSVVGVQLLPVGSINNNARLNRLLASLLRVDMPDSRAVVRLVAVTTKLIKLAATLRQQCLGGIETGVILEGIARKLREGHGAKELGDPHGEVSPTHVLAIPVNDLALQDIECDTTIVLPKVARVELDSHRLALLRAPDGAARREQSPDVLKSNSPVLEVILSKLDDLTELLLHDVVQQGNVLASGLVISLVILGSGELVPAVDEALKGGVELESRDTAKDTRVPIKDLAKDALQVGGLNDETVDDEGLVGIGLLGLLFVGVSRFRDIWEDVDLLLRIMTAYF